MDDKVGEKVDDRVDHTRVAKSWELDKGMPDIRDLGHIGQWLAEIGQEIWQRPCRSHRQAVLIVHIRRTNRHTGPFWICYGVCSCGTMTCLVLGVEVWTRPF